MRSLSSPRFASITSSISTARRWTICRALPEIGLQFITIPPTATKFSYVSFSRHSITRAIAERFACSTHGLHLKWDVIFQAGQLKTVDLFLNFPVMDINRNALWRNPDKVSQEQRSRMNAFWGDESWRQVGYEQTQGLFGAMEEKVSNAEFAEAFRNRLLKVAGFKRVPEPLPMRSRNAVVYYLFFASQVDVAEKIVVDIFNKYRNRGHG
jgi:hypothetical protein